MRPTDDQLRRFLAGTLPDAEAEAVGRWVEADPSALSILARLESADSLADALAEPSTRDDHTTPAGTPPDPHAPPTLPDGYRLLGELGRGGMGVVYVARDEEIDRQVAVKVLAAHLSGRSSVETRFRDEARITGQLQHPGIPPVYRVGELPDGRPFLAMKLIKGATLADLLRHAPAGVNRLGVFEQVCQAVGYAHAHGVIHRDLKPSNVMVGTFGEVQVMDWGLAKVLTASGGRQPADSPVANTLPTEIKSLRESDTRAGSVLGTPAYMSPEQAIGASDRLDRRTDVFGLGGILCALLTGRPPYVGSDGESTRHLAARAKLDDCFARLDGCGAEPDLVALCKRCLSADPPDRPADGQAVATEVAALRAAADERARRAEMDREKAVVEGREQRKRQRVVLGAAAVVAAVLVAGAGVSVWQMLRAMDAEGLATANAADAERSATAARGERDAKEVSLKAERAARTDAETNLAYAKKGNAILGSVFTGLDPHANHQTVAGLRDALKVNLRTAVKELDGSAIGDPLVVAEMQHTLGFSLLGIGDFDQAVTLFTRAHKTRAEKLGADHPATLASMNNLAAGYHAAGKSNSALPLWQEALRVQKGTLGADHPDTLTAMSNLAEVYRAVGRWDHALPLLEETLKLRKGKLGAVHRDTLQSMNNLAGGYLATGRVDEALPLLEETLKLRKGKFGAGHPDTLESMNNMAFGYREAGKLDLAMPLYEETLRLMTANLGADHADTLNTMNNLAAGYWSLRRLDRSVPLFEGLLPLREKKYGRTHPGTQLTVANLGVNYVGAGRVVEALPLLEEAYQSSRRFPELRFAGIALADGYVKAGQGAKAVKLIGEVVADARRLPPSDPHVVTALGKCGALLLDLRAFADAEPLLRQCLAIREKSQPNDWRTFDTQSLLGDALLGQKEYADAEPLLLKGYEGMKAREKAIPPQGATRIPEALDRLIALYHATETPGQVKKYQELRANYPTAKETLPPPRAEK